MKKIAVILLMLVYGVSSPGATLYIHYCCGKVDKVAFIDKKNTNCPFANRISQKGCCVNKEVELKIKSAYKAETAVKTVFKSRDLNVNSFSTVSSLDLPYSKRLLHFSDTSPPFSASVPIYIFDCVYRI